MFASLLIANRGEIACRIMRTARRLGIRTIAVYSDADATAQHVREADVALRIGPAPALASYLNIEAVVAAAVASGAEAVHPGYGFLSENAAFAEACSAAGLVFVGPSPAAIRAMGSKRAAKEIVAAAGTPVVPGYQGSDQTDARLAAEAARLGYPLLIKASAGGGGKGMRLVTTADAFEAALAGARREAAGAFGDDTVLLERYLTRPKHIEVQILADQRGHTLHLFERDCSVQRRHQKVIEEAPGPTVDALLRERLGAAAVQAARAIGYVGAGTIEFIAEGDAFYFMEMNTRMQVEHPVTEAITGLDLVEWQLRIAAGLPLALEQSAVAAVGHAIEARVYAEIPRRGFLPSSGALIAASFAGVARDGSAERGAPMSSADGIRVDAGVAAGDQVSVHYDPMLAKIIAHGPDRSTALRRLDAALARTVLVGVEHNVGFLRQVLATSAFQAGTYTTRLLDDEEAPVWSAPDDCGVLLAALALRAQASGDGPWGRSDGFRLNLAGGFQAVLAYDQQPRAVRLEPVSGSPFGGAS
ncbi:MAG: acetyl/propionyl/methylcrotonyl-CoA carboxylase subunit alpha, partial [Gammaproteobacteria bacterium]